MRGNTIIGVKLPLGRAEASSTQQSFRVELVTSYERSAPRHPLRLLPVVPPCAPWFVLSRLRARRGFRARGAATVLEHS